MKKRSFLTFNELSLLAKTKVIGVQNKDSGVGLGLIKFWGAWRQYTFQPYEDTVLNSDCMMEITAKLDEMNKDIRAEWAARRKAKEGGE
jgi:hypothetical protein